MNVLCIGVDHENAKHAYEDAQWAAHYLLDRGHTVTLDRELFGAGEHWDLFWFSGEVEDIRDRDLPLFAHAVFDCCDMGQRVEEDESYRAVWAASSGKAWNIMNSGSVFTGFIKRWVGESREPLVTAAGFNADAVAYVGRCVRHYSRKNMGFYEPQQPVCGRWR